MDGNLDGLLNRLGDALGDPSLKRKTLTQKTDYDALIEDSASRHGVDSRLIRAMMSQESSFKKHATSPKGASGLMQLMPATAQRFGVTDIYDPKQNIEAGTKYTKWLLDRFKGNVDLALAGYNAGEGAVDKYDGRIPPYAETQNYVKQIRANYDGNGYGNTPQPPPADLSNFLGNLNGALGEQAAQPNDNLNEVLNALGGDTPPTQPTPTVPGATVSVQTPNPTAELEAQRAELVRDLNTAKLPKKKKQIQASITKLDSSIAALKRDNPPAQPPAQNPYIIAPLPTDDGKNTANNQIIQTINEARQVFDANGQIPPPPPLPGQPPTAQPQIEPLPQAPPIRPSYQPLPEGMSENPVYQKRDLSTLKDGETYYPFEKTGKDSAGRDYLGTVAGEHRFRNSDGDEIGYDPQSDSSRVIGTTKKAYDSKKNEYIRTNDQSDVIDGTRYEREGRNYIFGTDGAIREEYSMMQAGKTAQTVQPPTGQRTPKVAGQRTRKHKERTDVKILDDDAPQQYDFQQTGKLPLSNGESLNYQPDKTEGLKEGEHRFGDEAGNTFILNPATNELRNEDIDVAEKVIIPLSPRSVINTPDVALIAQAGVVADQIADKYGFEKEDVIDFYRNNGFTDLATGEKLPEERLFTKEKKAETTNEKVFGKPKDIGFGKAETDFVNITKGDIKNIRKFSELKKETKAKLDAAKAEYAKTEDDYIAGLKAERDVLGSDAKEIDKEIELYRADRAAQIRQIEQYQFASGQAEIRTPEEIAAEVREVTTKDRQDVLNIYGSYTAKREAYEKWKNLSFKEKSSEVLTSLLRTPLNALSAIYKTAGAAESKLSGVNPHFTAYPTDKSFFYKLGDIAEEFRDTYLPQKPIARRQFLVQAADSIGQVVLMAGSAAATGGITLGSTIGLSQGFSAQYDEAKKAGATENQRLATAVIGALGAVPDIFITRGWFKFLTKSEKVGLLSGIARSTFQKLSVKVGEVEAESITRSAFQKLLSRATALGEKHFGNEVVKQAEKFTFVGALKTSAKGLVVEGLQESPFEDTINEAGSRLTYGKTTKDGKPQKPVGQVTSIGDAFNRLVYGSSGEGSAITFNPESFVGGAVGGAFGGTIQVVTEHLNAGKFQDAEKAIDDAVAKKAITEFQSGQLKDAVKEAVEQTEKPTVWIVEDSFAPEPIKPKDEAKVSKPPTVATDEVLPADEVLPEKAKPKATFFNAAKKVKVEALETVTPVADTSPSLEGVAKIENPTTNDGKKIVGFKTAKGSTYTVNGSSTQRNKSLHTDSGHEPTDVGLKKPSAVTYYGTQIQARLFTFAGEEKIVGNDNLIRVTPQPDGTVKAEALRYNSVQKKWFNSSKTYPDISPILTTTPKVGLHPIELWQPQDKGDKSGIIGYRGTHGGNAITELVTESGNKTTPTQPIAKNDTVTLPADKKTGEVKTGIVAAVGTNGKKVSVKVEGKEQIVKVENVRRVEAKEPNGDVVDPIIEAYSKNPFGHTIPPGSVIKANNQEFLVVGNPNSSGFNVIPANSELAQQLRPLVERKATKEEINKVLPGWYKKLQAEQSYLRKDKTKLVTRIKTENKDVPTSTPENAPSSSADVKEPYQMTQSEYKQTNKISDYVDKTAIAYGVKLILGESALKDGKLKASSILPFYDAFKDKGGAKGAEHFAQVAYALKEGKTVPAEVLADYPDLQAKQPAPENAQASSADVKGEANAIQQHAIEHFEQQKLDLDSLVNDVKFRKAVVKGKTLKVPMVKENGDPVMSKGKQATENVPIKEVLDEIKERHKLWEDLVKCVNA